MDPDALCAVFLSTLQEADQLVVSAVHTAIREKPDEVDGISLERVRDVLPASASKGAAILECNVYQPGALVYDLA